MLIMTNLASRFVDDPTGYGDGRRFVHEPSLRDHTKE
jgi:hypothetical protein